MVLVVSSVEVDVTWIDEQEREQDDEDLDGVFPSVNKVSIKQIGLLQGWHVILQNKGSACHLNTNSTKCHNRFQHIFKVKTSEDGLLTL